jgi:hypothetical protein
VLGTAVFAQVAQAIQERLRIDKYHLLAASRRGRAR